MVPPVPPTFLLRRGETALASDLPEAVVALGGSVTACAFLSQTHRCLGGIDKVTAYFCMHGAIPRDSQPVNNQ